MKSWYAQLTPDQRQALVQHKAHSENVRRSLLGQALLPVQTGEHLPTPSMMAALDAAIAGWSLPSDATLYCGVEFGGNVRKWIEDGKYMYPAFISTTLYGELAVGSFIKRFDRDPILLAFNLPAGFPCAPYDLFTEFAGEPELLLARGLRFKVVDAQPSNSAAWDENYGDPKAALTVLSLSPA